MRLDGETLLQDGEPALFMPAFHRPENKRFTELDVEAGEHELEVVIQMKAGGQEVFLLPVSTAETAQPDPWYYYTDILFL